ncbi:hypothetical protein Tco_1171356, partial [Tanacetum coccineum]
HSWSLHVIKEDKLVEPTSFPVKETNTRDESWISHLLEAYNRGTGSHKEEPAEEFHVINQYYHELTFAKPENQTYIKWGSKSRIASSGTKRTGKKSRVKTERNISLQVLHPDFVAEVMSLYFEDFEKLLNNLDVALLIIAFWLVIPPTLCLPIGVLAVYISSLIPG